VVWDVVVVGAGNAALVAAVAAAEEGARVTVLEKATKELRGGNTRFTGGLFRFVYEHGAESLKPIVDHEDYSRYQIDPYTAQNFWDDIQRVTGGKAHPELTKTLIDRSYETILWMKKIGVRFEFARDSAVPVPGRPGIYRLPFGTAVRSVGEGLGLSDRLFVAAEQAGVEVQYEVAALRPELNERGEVAGVWIKSRRGEVRKLECKSIVLACGGFQANPEMRAAYLGPLWSTAKVRGTRFDTGDLHREVLNLGAAPLGDWAGCHATPIDVDAPDYGDLRLTDKTNRLSYPYGILVNLDGLRFVDEGEDFALYTYAKMGGEILRQRQGVAFQVFDKKVLHLLEPRYATAKPVEAQTIEELGRRIADRYPQFQFKVEQFVETVAAFNRACQGGSFDPSRHDGVSTQGIWPPKSNWALPLDTPPFVAYGVTGGITFTFGGIRIDAEAQVIDRMDRAIPGLYATGEITGGFFYHNYPAGTGLMRGAVFGRIAGTNAARYALERR
jgi:tricarballylate dehydrogenase